VQKSQIQHAYTITAEEYANKFFHEFDHKPFDRMVLKECGHFPYIEQPKEFFSTERNFVKKSAR